jgi:DNA-binding winged helix-turn-helix (wHTH) protein
VKTAFGSIVVDDEARQVLNAGVPVHLSPKAFDLLALLIRERPRVVSKEVLHRRLWPDSFVSDTSLATLVAEVRAALGEDARQPGAVRTVHRRGYAFQHDVRVLDTPGPSRLPACALIVAGRVCPLHVGDNIVGRSPSAEVWLDAPSVSRQHARIRVSDDGVTLEDLGSKNGTCVGNERLGAGRRLNDGDRLRFGAIDAVFSRYLSAPTLTEGGS